MANILRQNVWVIDSTGQLDGIYKVKSIKLVAGGDAATLSIKADSTSGDVVYVAGAATNGANYDSDLCVNFPQGLHVTITGTSAKAYLYLE